jgi:hypothetical protein
VESPDDYFHINAVNLDGQFAWQHDPLPAGEGTIRLFDNESDGSTRVLSHSRVIWVHLDTVAKTATLLKEIAHPLGVSAASQGNAEGLDNGNTFVGWGQLGRVSEFDPQGKLLFDAVLPGTYNTYRGYRAGWAGRPDTQPTATAWTNKNGTTTVHAMWNGATEVGAWRVIAGARASALKPARTAPWNGLDTRVVIAAFRTRSRSWRSTRSAASSARPRPSRPTDAHTRAAARPR